MIVCKYKFNNTIYDLIPVFNDGYEGYTVTDEVDTNDSSITTRTIECDALPTLMRFSTCTSNGIRNDSRELALLEVTYINNDNLTTEDLMFNACTNLTKVEGFTSNIMHQINHMFNGCINLTQLDVSNFDTSNVTSMQYMFSSCNQLTQLDISNFDTSNVIYIQYMFYNCKLLTQLDVSNFNTSNVTNMDCMFYNCTLLTTLDLSNFNTSNVTTMSYMFGNCYSLSSLDVSNFNTSKVTNMYCMFQGCNSLTSLDVSNWDTSKISDMYCMFNNCYKLTSLDLSTWNTSNVTYMDYMFCNCTSLTTLDLSKFDTSNVTYMDYMFYNCNKLTSLDVSTWNTSNVTYMDYMFTDTPLLTDIGMLYCSKDTVNKVMSLFTDGTRTIWVKDTNSSEYTNTNYVTVRNYSREKELQLNSPLLEGDKLVKMNGNIYHYHKMGKIVLDGSDDDIYYDITNISNTNENTKRVFITSDSWGNGKTVNSDTFFMCDTLEKINYTMRDIDKKCIAIGGISGREIHIVLNKSELSNLEISGFKQWLSNNPTTVIYELAEPWYELISTDDSIYLPLEDSGTNVVVNNSTIPTTNTVENRTFSTIVLKNNTIYTVAFDKIGTNEVTIDLGGTVVTTANTEIEIQTPSTLTREDIIFYGDDSISNVRVVESSELGGAMPSRTFEGLENSFEDGLLPNENLFICNNRYINENSQEHVAQLKDAITNNIYTIYNPMDKLIYLPMYKNGIWDNQTNINPKEIKLLSLSNIVTVNAVVGKSNDGWNSENLNELHAIILEGDWTHLSEEDFNNLGKYKVEYKVVGKNKFDINDAWTDNEKYSGFVKSNDYIQYSNNGFHTYIKSDFKPDTQYTFTLRVSYSLSSNIDFVIRYTDDSYEKLTLLASDANTIRVITHISQSGKSIKCLKQFYSDAGVVTLYKDGTQIEEGTVATDYEPYKESTKTYYLSSPLLEGDTIEEIDKKIYHVKRRYMVTLGADSDWVQPTDLGHVIRFQKETKYPALNSKVIANQLYKWHTGYVEDWEHYYIWNSQFYIFINKTKLISNDVNGLRQWLQKHPIIVVYELAEPQYELLSEEPLLLDSYVDGDLTFNTNITLDKISFSSYEEELTYLYANKTYTIQFNSNSEGIGNVYLGGTLLENKSIIKGLNKIYITTPSILVDNKININVTNGSVYISDVVVTNSTMEFDYFDGIKSSFENSLVTDENDEHYGKYEVGIKVVGEPYKEHNATVYLNSPLLEGDKIEVKDGKLCHYHKMGMVVLDGTQSIINRTNGGNYDTDSTMLFTFNMSDYNWKKKSGSNEAIKCDQFSSMSYNDVISSNQYVGITTEQSFAVIYCRIAKSKLSTQDTNGFKQWLLEHPTTVVYELEEPYYEDITPIQSSFVVTTAQEGDMEILTNLPIKSNITYLTNVTSAIVLEQQLDEVDNTQSLNDILDEEINE